MLRLKTSFQNQYLAYFGDRRGHYVPWRRQEVALVVARPQAVAI